MVMSQPDVPDFQDYLRYCERFAVLQSTDGIAPTQRPLTFRRYRLVAARGGDVDELLFPKLELGKRVYLASPLGFSEVGEPYRHAIHDALEALELEVFDPWDWEGHGPFSRDGAVDRGRQNFQVLETCGRVLAVLDGPDVDSGTACEIGYARALGRRIDGIHSGARPTPEATPPVNLQVLTAILDSGGNIVTGLDELGDLSWGSVPP